MAATNIHDPFLVPAPALQHDTEGKETPTHGRATHSEEDRMEDGVLLDAILTGQAVHEAAPARGRLFVEEQQGQSVCLQGDVHRATNAEGMDVCEDQGPEVIQSAPVAPAPGRPHVHALAPDQALIPRTRDIVGAGVGQGRLARGGEVIVGKTLGTAGPGLRRLCNISRSTSAVFFSFPDLVVTKRPLGMVILVVRGKIQLQHHK